MSKWDERYSRGEHATDEPSRVLVRAVEALKPGRALDIACGVGRHAVYLAEHGFDVTAVDASRAGLEIMLERARARGVQVDARVADLERGEFIIEPHAYDLICDFYYLQRDLLPQIRAGVRTGGTVVAAIHLVDDDAETPPMNPAFLLQPGELLTLFAGWEINHYHETQRDDADAFCHHRRTAEIIAKKVGNP